MQNSQIRRAIYKRPSILRTIRGELPPPAGATWTLNVETTDAELMTSNPIFGGKKHDVKVRHGTLSGIGSGQFEMTIGFACNREFAFQSRFVKRPDSFRYLAKGELINGSIAAIAVMRIHDLSWVLGYDPNETSRILTMTLTVERVFWEDEDNSIRAPWLTRSSAELFLHTEWLLDGDQAPAA